MAVFVITGTNFMRVDLFLLIEPRRELLRILFSAMRGTVAYISRASNDSAYGKYIVLEHEQFTPVLYTLYAHLEEIHKNLSHRSQVKVAQPLKGKWETRRPSKFH